MFLALSFDFWNTLYAPGLETERQLLRVARFSEEIEKHRSVETREIEAAFAASSEYFFTEWQINQRTPTPSERIAHMSARLGIRLDESQITGLSDYFGSLIFEIPPAEIPGIKELIARLAESYPLGIISDTGYISGKYIRRFLEKENLLSFFKSLIFSDEEKNSKPHKSLFYKTAANLGVSPGQIIHIGDLEQTDIHGAVSAGFRSIKFIGENAPPENESAADQIIASYADFDFALQEILGYDPQIKSNL